MCLLVVFHHAHPDAPLIVAANRDEFLARAAISMTVLRAKDPRVLGGRDEVAGGTWAAVSERGLFAGLTNVPTPVRDPKLRSRGELPLALAVAEDATRGVEAFRQTLHPHDYNPAWILAGDRRALYYVDMTSGETPAVTPLPPGLHVLENRPYGADSPKVDHVRSLLAGAESRRGPALVALLYDVLRDHRIPDRARNDPTRSPRRPLETEAACVHAGPYGTRSSMIVVVGAQPGPPGIWYTDGAPCEQPLQDASNLWR